MTFDEIVYSPAGLSYLEKGDFRLNMEHPPLSKYLLALPLYILGYKNDYESVFWKKGDQIRFGRDFYFEKGNLKTLHLSRFSTIITTLALSIFIYLFVLKNFGKTEALLSLFFFIFYPDNIAQGSLATTDMFFSFFFFLSLYFFYFFIKKTNLKNCFLCVFFSSLTLITRHTGFLLFPVYFIFLIYLFLKRKIALKKIIFFLLFYFILAYIIIWGGYLFKGKVILQGNLINSKFLPAAYEEGFKISKDLVSKRLSFFLGEIHRESPKKFFLVSFLLKTPIPLLILIFLSFFLKINKKTITLWLPFLILFVLTSLISPTASHRYLLFIYPFIFILCALVGTQLLKKKWDKIFLYFLIFFNVFSFFRFFPYNLSYVNEFIKKESSSFYFVDSNLDWGQGLCALKNYLKKEKIEEIYLSYFGTANPKFYGINFKVLPSYHQELYWESFYPKKITLEKGKKLAISITNLSGLYQPVYFGEIVNLQRPEKIVGGSVYIYTSQKDAEFEFQENSPIRWKIIQNNMIK